MFAPGRIWNDLNGQPIQAHGGGILYEQGKYYWFGENKNGPTLPQGGRVDVIGVSCYSSSDLLHWQDEGIVLPAVQDNPDHDLAPTKIVERPKVIYNRETQSYVMWMHIDTADYTYARAGVAVSATPTGPYRYVESVTPCNTDCRDLTVFQDDDGAAYLIFASEYNRNITIAQLSDDYLTIKDVFTKQFSYPRRHEGREAPAMFKHAGKYYLITSGCTGWAANAAECAVASSPFGPWQVVGNPCTGPQAEYTFNAQGTFVLPLPGQQNAFIFLADRWNPRDLSDSRYVWLPLQVKAGIPEIPWHETWDLTIFHDPDPHKE
ncbi:glycoside hydrolase family 43 protein [Dictyobacter kobayashii]|uniref:Glycosyl hydrolase family 43 n=1 Tax=Dictyobacter kobayashii TaxID=2014872 RepID=A0A402ANJ8_9CHLR|nr:glycoside hydrolase family 43 protein [Dictyobacter kobayashii]GCE20771.1 glycosyl hydrolase family 43 [Dictyobacter kobayashii]